LFGSANNLEMFSMSFGAKFVFKLLAKIAFKKIILKNGILGLKWVFDYKFKIYLKFQNAPLIKVV
jgi:hypothetical protein